MEEERQLFYLKVGERITLKNTVERENLYTSLESDDNTKICLKDGSDTNRLFNRSYNVIEFDKSFYVIRDYQYNVIELGLSDEMIRAVKRYKQELNEYSFNDFQKEQFIKEEFARKRVK